jgi:hypothetical protein
MKFLVVRRSAPVETNYGGGDVGAVADVTARAAKVVNSPRVS